jgi:hypothetical protein
VGTPLWDVGDVTGPAALLLSACPQSEGIDEVRRATRRLASGPTVKEAIETIDAQTRDDRPAFYGINCSHPLEFMPAIEPGAWFERVRCLRPNAAMIDKISLCTLGHLESGDPVELGELMGGLARQYSHIDMWWLLRHVGDPPRRDRA